MSLSATKETFLKNFYTACKKVCPSYNLLAIAGITAQAMNETGYGTTGLSKYNNFWGMKAGSSYKGKTVTMKTWEEVNGKKVTVNAKFRAFDTMEEGIKGYCEFIKSYSRYKNLFGVTDNEQFIKNIKNDGWATDSAYVTKVTKILKTYVLPLCGTSTATATSNYTEPTKLICTTAKAKEKRYISTSWTNKGEGVKWVQDKLTKKGYDLSGHGGIDGVYGSFSESCIKDLQKKKGLTIDGIVGKNTRTALKG